jgi:two-component system chemotaxis response regulator CheB
MAKKTKISSLPKQISVLIVDDSLIFRRLLKEIFERTNTIKIIGEAVNGIEALDKVLKLNPDVIIMDMEMPLMDGMTSLQHLMIHMPTPTIMVSSLTREGTARGLMPSRMGRLILSVKTRFFNKKKSARLTRRLFIKYYMLQRSW